MDIFIELKAKLNRIAKAQIKQQNSIVIIFKISGAHRTIATD